MVVIAVLLLLEAVAIWALRRWQDAHLPMASQQLAVSTVEASGDSKSMGRSALTEDDVILFGLVLEASNDVVADLLADSS